MRRHDLFIYVVIVVEELSFVNKSFMEKEGDASSGFA